MIIEKQGFIGILLDNETYYFNKLFNLCESWFCEKIKVIKTNEVYHITCELLYNTPANKKLFIKKIITFHYELGINVEISKSINTIKNIQFTVG